MILRLGEKNSWFLTNNLYRLILIFGYGTEISQKNFKKWYDNFV
jgi:hypothetical protein